MHYNYVNGREGRKYSYDGPVMVFNNCVLNHWKAETVASSEKRAKSNLAYQYKKKYNLTASAKVTLPGEVTLIN